MEGSLEEVLKAARLLIMQFDRQDQAELIDFDSRVVTRTSFTDDTGAMLQSLGEVEVGGGTALFDAVAAGLDHLRPHQGMKAVLVLSDGEDENSMEHSLESLRPRLRNEGVRVFTIALGASVDAGTMTEIAELSGGAFYQADRSEDVGGIYTGIITYLHSLHRMWYSTALGAFDGSRHTLRVEHEPSGTVQSAEYRAPEDEYWSHAIDVRPESQAAPIRITPDGDYTALLQHMAVIDSNGRRHTLHDWGEMYDGSITEHYICGYTHRNYGSLNHYDPAAGTVKEIEPHTIIEGANGSFHQEWEWYPKAISPNEEYLVLCADPDDEELDFDYYFMLFDRVKGQVLWERGFYIGEFDEPGPASVADTGLAGIVQDDNLYMVEPDGGIRYARMWEETGRRWQRLDLSADGSLCIGRVATGDRVWAASTDGTILWEKTSRCHEKGGFVSISPNGKYFGYADQRGPHICDRAGTVLFEIPPGEISHIDERYMRNGIDIADDGSFVYSLANQLYYDRLED
jgi:hypothetical protein